MIKSEVVNGVSSEFFSIAPIQLSRSPCLSRLTLCSHNTLKAIFVDFSYTFYLMIIWLISVFFMTVTELMVSRCIFIPITSTDRKRPHKYLKEWMECTNETIDN